MRFRLLTLVAALMLASVRAGAADAPAVSQRPEARPGATTRAVSVAMASAVVAPSVPGLRASLRPRPRPGTAPAQERPAAVARPAVANAPPKPKVRVVLASSGAAVRISPRPDIRPPNLHRRSVVRAAGVRVPAPPVIAGPRGAVCGDNAIRGQTLSPIAGRLKGCGVEAPVRVTSVDGVALTQPATMDCTTAKALKGWVHNAVKPSVGRLGGGVVSLRVAAHYSCRTRNSQPGAKISEHGRGRAIDISAINLKNGVSITVLKGWRDNVQGKILKAMHRGACGRFGTVLGPNADRFHQDHFHLDTARHRGGAYCR